MFKSLIARRRPRRRRRPHDADRRRGRGARRPRRRTTARAPLDPGRDPDPAQLQRPFLRPRPGERPAGPLRRRYRRHRRRVDRRRCGAGRRCARSGQLRAWSARAPPARSSGQRVSLAASSSTARRGCTSAAPCCKAPTSRCSASPISSPAALGRDARRRDDPALAAYARRAPAMARAMSSIRAFALRPIAAARSPSPPRASPPFRHGRGDEGADASRSAPIMRCSGGSLVGRVIGGASGSRCAARGRARAAMRIHLIRGADVLGDGDPVLLGAGAGAAGAGRRAGLRRAADRALSRRPDPQGADRAAGDPRLAARLCRRDGDHGRAGGGRDGPGGLLGRARRSSPRRSSTPGTSS